MLKNEIIIRCLRCGQKNRIQRDHMSDRPLCGRCRAPLDELILRCLACGTRNFVSEERLHDRPICGRCGVPLYQGYAVDVSDDTFSGEVTSFPGPVLMCCWAPWCGSARTMIPILNRLGRRYAGGVKIAKLNIYENPRIVSRYDIKNPPTLLLFRGGKLVHKLEGEKTIEDLENYIQSILKEIPEYSD